MSQIKWSVKDVANIMHISNIVGDLIMRKESLEELTNYGQITDLVTDPNLQIQSILFKSFYPYTFF